MRNADEKRQDGGSNKGGNNKTIWKREVKINSVIGENISLVNSAFDDL